MENERNSTIFINNNLLKYPFFISIKTYKTDEMGSNLTLVNDFCHLEKTNKEFVKISNFSFENNEKFLIDKNIIQIDQFIILTNKKSIFLYEFDLKYNSTIFRDKKDFLIEDENSKIFLNYNEELKLLSIVINSELYIYSINSNKPILELKKNITLSKLNDEKIKKIIFQKNYIFFQVNNEKIEIFKINNENTTIEISYFLTMDSQYNNNVKNISDILVFEKSLFFLNEEEGLFSIVIDKLKQTKIEQLLNIQNCINFYKTNSSFIILQRKNNYINILEYFPFIDDDIDFIEVFKIDFKINNILLNQDFFIIQSDNKIMIYQHSIIFNKKNNSNDYYIISENITNLNLIHLWNNNKFLSYQNNSIEILDLLFSNPKFYCEGMSQINESNYKVIVSIYEKTCSSKKNSNENSVFNLCLYKQNFDLKWSESKEYANSKEKTNNFYLYFIIVLIFTLLILGGLFALFFFLYKKEKEKSYVNLHELSFINQRKENLYEEAPETNFKSINTKKETPHFVNKDEI